MKKLFILITAVALQFSSFAQIEYYFPEGTQIDQSIPTPQDVLGYEIGEWHTRHDLMTKYVLNEGLTNIRNINYSAEWQQQPLKIRQKVISAIHISLKMASENAILICTSSKENGRRPPWSYQKEDPATQT